MHPPEAIRGEVELEAGHRAPGLHHPGQFAERRGGIIDVAQEVGEGQRVEGVIGKGQTARLARRPAGPGRSRRRGDVALALRQHRLGEVHADDVGRRPLGELRCATPAVPEATSSTRPGDVGTIRSIIARRHRPFCPMERTSASRS